MDIGTYIPPLYLPDVITSIRHPESLHNVAFKEALRAGISNKDSPLTVELGSLQLNVIAEVLNTERFGPFDGAFSSTFLRAIATPVKMGLAHRLVVSSDLNERSMGVWHEFPPEEVLEKYPDEKSPYDMDWSVEDYYHYCPRGGESCADVEARLMRFFGNAAAFEGARNILISGHGISGLCQRKLLTGASIGTWKQWSKGELGGRLKNASITLYERRGQFYETTLYNYAPWEGKVPQHLLQRKGNEA